MKLSNMQYVYLFGVSILSIGIGGWANNPWIGLFAFGVGIVLMVIGNAIDRSDNGEP